MNIKTINEPKIKKNGIGIVALGDGKIVDMVIYGKTGKGMCLGGDYDESMATVYHVEDYVKKFILPKSLNDSD